MKKKLPKWKKISKKVNWHLKNLKKKQNKQGNFKKKKKKQSTI